MEVVPQIVTSNMSKFYLQEEYTPCSDLAFREQNKIHVDVFLVLGI